VAIKIIANSPAMQRVLELVERVSQTDTTVLVRGESGTGKDLVAQELHYKSKRSNGPFVKIDCSSLPQTLLESELFGYEKGAFTGATEKKAGRFEAADGGTLVLDEIASLSLTAQAKLLRVIEERSFERLGGTKPTVIDTRIVALTNVDLEDAVKRREFREDLLYRLNVVTVFVPPLRDRTDDFARLVAEFVKQSATKHGKKVQGLTEEAASTLCGYDYPGNARELQNIIERAVITCDSTELELRHLPEFLRSSMRLIKKTESRLTLAQLEEAYIREILEVTRNQKTRAASILGISRKNLYEKIKRYGIEGALR
jgi:transcriptional regulator with PAS, ATPase and Fis domain